MEPTTTADLYSGEALTVSMPGHGVLCLHDSAGANGWYTHQVDAFGATTWEAPGGNDLMMDGPPRQLQDWVDAAAGALRESAGVPMHILATGKAAYGAIVLAAQHPDLVTSVILGDPQVDTGVEGYSAMLGLVRVPSLVIAAAPEPDTDISKPQSIAGGIDNGVFVILDHTAVPAHRNRPESFNEWTQSFMHIAEGLHAFVQPQEATSA